MLGQLLQSACKIVAQLVQVVRNCAVAGVVGNLRQGHSVDACLRSNLTRRDGSAFERLITQAISEKALDIELTEPRTEPSAEAITEESDDE